MTAEQESVSEKLNPLQILAGKNYVIAETFPIRRPNNFSDEKAKEGVLTLLSDQRVTGPVAITFCNSSEDQIRGIINALKILRALNRRHEQEMIIVGFNADQLQNMFTDISSMFLERIKNNEQNPILEGIDPANLTLLLLNAENPMIPINDGKARPNIPTVDPRTELRLIALEKGRSRTRPAQPLPLPLIKSTYSRCGKFCGRPAAACW